MGRFRRAWERFYPRIKYDIFQFAAELGFDQPINTPGGITWQQADMLQAVQIATHGFPSPSYPQITSRARENVGKPWLAVKSGQGPGKSKCSNIIGLWRTFQAPRALTMVTAPTMDQCREVWLAGLREILDQRCRNSLIKDIVEATRSRVVIDGDTDWAIKFCTSKTEQAAQGRHHPYMTWIAEEASGIPRALMVQIEGTLSNLKGEDMNGMFLAIGNPNTRECYFFDCFTIDRERWWTYTMNAEETPAYVVSQWRNQILAQKYGRDSDVYRIRVLGEFPSINPRCVIAAEDLHACTRTDPNECMRYGRYVDGRLVPVRQVGIDFARFGGDENVIFCRAGRTVVHWECLRNTDPNVALDRAFAIVRQLGWTTRQHGLSAHGPDAVRWVVDAGGMGQGLLQRLYDARLDVFEFHFGGSSSSAEYKDRVTEAFFGVADMARQRTIHIPADSRLIGQLSTRHYKPVEDKGKTKFQVESKQEYFDRLQRESGKVETVTSPDRADALVMCFYEPAGQDARIATRDSSGRRIA
jgi:phage terminase large subunit